MRKRPLFVPVVGSLLLLPRFVTGHHSAAAYETAKQITVTGSVTEFHFVNPHVLIYISAKNEGGTIRKWQGEMTSPNHLIRAGWNKDIMKAGDPIALTGSVANRNSNKEKCFKQSERIRRSSVRGQRRSMSLRDSFSGIPAIGPFRIMCTASMP